MVSAKFINMVASKLEELNYLLSTNDKTYYLTLLRSS